MCWWWLVYDMNKAEDVIVKMKEVTMMTEQDHKAEFGRQSQFDLSE